MLDDDNALQAWQKAYEIADNSFVPDHPTMKKIVSHLHCDNLITPSSQKLQQSFS